MDAGRSRRPPRFESVPRREDGSGRLDGERRSSRAFAARRRRGSKGRGPRGGIATTLTTRLTSRRRGRLEETPFRVGKCIQSTLVVWSKEYVLEHVVV